MTSKPSELDPVRAFEPLSPASGSKDRSSHSHRQLIGVLGFILTPLSLGHSCLEANRPRSTVAAAYLDKRLLL